MVVSACHKCLGAQVVVVVGVLVSSHQPACDTYPCCVTLCCGDTHSMRARPSQQTQLLTALLHNHPPTYTTHTVLLSFDNSRAVTRAPLPPSFPYTTT